MYREIYLTDRQTDRQTDRLEQKRKVPESM